MADFTRHPSGGQKVDASEMRRHLDNLLSIKSRYISGYDYTHTGGLDFTITTGVAIVDGGRIGVAGDSDFSGSCTDNDINHVWLDSDGNIEIETSGTPSDPESIKLYELEASGGTINDPGTGNSKDTRPNYDLVEIETDLKAKTFSATDSTDAKLSGDKLYLSDGEPFIEFEATTANVTSRVVHKGGHLVVTDSAGSSDTLEVDTVNQEVEVTNQDAGGNPTLWSNDANVARLELTGYLDISQRLRLPTTGATNAGIEIGGDVLLYRSATNTLRLQDDDLVVGGGTITVTNQGSGGDPVLDANASTQLLALTGALSISSDVTFGTASQDYLLQADGAALALEGQGANTNAVVTLHSADGDATEDVRLGLFAAGAPGATDVEELRVGFDAANTRFEVESLTGGTGMTLRPIHIFAGANPDQFVIRTSGDLHAANNVRIGSAGAPSDTLDVDGTLDVSGSAELHTELGVGTSGTVHGVLDVTGGAVYLGSPSTAPADGNLDTGQLTFWTDSDSDQVNIKAKDSQGDVVNIEVGEAGLLNSHTYMGA